MIRHHEKKIAWRAGFFTLLVHGMLLLVMLFSFQWKSVKPMQITTVELWDNLPSQPSEQVESEPEPVKPTAPPPPKPEPTPQPKVEPKPQPKLEAKPEPKPEPPVKADIQVKKTEPKPEPVKKEEKPSEVENQKAEALKKIQESLLKEDVEFKREEKPKSAPPAEVKSKVALQGSVVDPSEVAKYIALITAEIKQHVNSQVCTNGKPELQFMIALMPSGLVNGKPKLISSNASAACNDAVERAILESQPLPVPKQADLFNQFRELKLKFRPNDE